MLELVEYIARELVENPDSVKELLQMMEKGI